MSETRSSREPFYAVSSEGYNRIESGTIPLIVLPGFMGTRLQFSRRWNRNYRWDPDDEVEMGLSWISNPSWYFSRTINSRVAAKVMEEGSFSEERLARGWGGPARTFYGAMLEHLDGLDFGSIRTPVYAIGYDWRQSNANSSAYVEGKLRQILRNEDSSRFVLLTHSMGGLVGRALLKRAPDLSERAVGVVHIGQPAFGASVMYRRLFTGASLFKDDLLMWLILGDQPDEFQRIASGIPGSLELLPTDRMKGPSGEPWLRYRTADEPERSVAFKGKPSENYQSLQSPPGIISQDPSQIHSIDEKYHAQMRQGIEGAFSFHAALGAWHHPNTWTISTNDMKTDHVVEFVLPPKRPIKTVGPALGGPEFASESWIGGKTSDGEVVLWYPERLDWKSRYLVENPDPSRDLGDHTVPLPSSIDLLGSPTCKLSELSEKNVETNRQVFVSGVEHSAMSNDSQVACALEIILSHLVGQGL